MACHDVPDDARENERHGDPLSIGQDVTVVENRHNNGEKLAGGGHGGGNQRVELGDGVEDEELPGRGGDAEH